MTPHQTPAHDAPTNANDLLDQIRTHVTTYEQALAARQHGGVAAGKLADALVRLVGAHATTDLPQPPVPRYRLTVKVTGNTHEEIEGGLVHLVHGGYTLDTNYYTRDEFWALDGTTTARLEHVNPDQTPENYRTELDAWARRSGLVHRAPLHSVGRAINVVDHRIPESGDHHD